jgi:hypothetical protein
MVDSEGAAEFEPLRRDVTRMLLDRGSTQVRARFGMCVREKMRGFARVRFVRARFGKKMCEKMRHPAKIPSTRLFALHAHVTPLFSRVE